LDIQAKFRSDNLRNSNQIGLIDLTVIYQAIILSEFKT
jgi:hypothetical protein